MLITIATDSFIIDFAFAAVNAEHYFISQKSHRHRTKAVREREHTIIRTNGEAKHRMNEILS